MGLIDEFRLFSYSAPALMIEVISNECHFGPSKSNLVILVFLFCLEVIKNYKRDEITAKDTRGLDNNAETIEKDLLSREEALEDNLGMEDDSVNKYLDNENEDYKLTENDQTFK